MGNNKMMTPAPTGCGGRQEQQLNGNDSTSTDLRDVVERMVTSSECDGDRDCLDAKLADLSETTGLPLADLTAIADEVEADLARLTRGETLADLDTAAERYATTGDAAEHTRGLALLGDLLGVAVESITRYEQDPPRWRIAFDRRATGTLSAAEILRPSTLRARVAEATSLVLAETRPPEHRRIAQAILYLAEPVDTGPEATLHGAVTMWVGDFIGDPERLPERDARAIDAGAFTHRGRAYLRLGRLQRHIATQFADRVPTNRLAEALRDLGARPEKMTVRTANGTPSVSVYDVTPLLADDETTT